MGQHHQVALLSQTPAGSATIVIHFISPLWRLQQICSTQAAPFIKQILPALNQDATLILSYERLQSKK